MADDSDPKPQAATEPEWMHEWLTVLGISRSESTGELDHWSHRETRRALSLTERFAKLAVEVTELRTKVAMLEKKDVEPRKFNPRMFGETLQH